MSFNVYKINFVDDNDKDMEEIIHSDTKQDAIVQLKVDYKVKKIVKIMQMPTISEMKKTMASNE